MSRESLDQKPLPPPSKPRPETSILQPPSTLTNQDEGDVKSQSHLVTVKPLTVDTSTSLAQQNTSTTKKPTLIKSSSTSTNNGGAPAKILNNSIASPIFQSTPLQSSTNVSGATNLPVRNQSVSFSDIDIQEKSRRFTISAQPSSVSILQDNNSNPQQQRQPGSNLPSRQSSINRKRIGSPNYSTPKVPSNTNTNSIINTSITSATNTNTNTTAATTTTTASTPIRLPSINGINKSTLFNT